MAEQPLAVLNLELHVSHACNLTCDSCAHYSNQGHKGLLAVDEAERWMRPWSDRIRPRVFSLVGGEPSINPALTAITELAGKLWPDARIRVLTNGFFLHRHPELPAVLARHRNLLEVSIHSREPEYLQELASIRTLVNGWERDHGINVRWTGSLGMWTRRYKGWGPTMQPFNDGDQRSSWENCRARLSPQLFEGKLWKCPALAYLGMQHQRHGLSTEWDRYLAYQPLEPACSRDELTRFFAIEDEPYCEMCPAKPERFTMPSPLIPVSALLVRHASPRAQQSATDR